MARPSSSSKNFLVEAIMAKPVLSGNLFFRGHDLRKNQGHFVKFRARIQYLVCQLLLPEDC